MKKRKAKKNITEKRNLKIEAKSGILKDNKTK